MSKKQELWERVTVLECEVDRLKGGKDKARIYKETLTPCPNCGGVIEHQMFRWCPWCGCRLNRCQFCKDIEPNNMDGNFCGNCGRNLRKGE